MKHLLLLLFITGMYTCCFAQTEIAFPFTSEDDNRLINEVDSGKYYIATGDTTNIIFINDETLACQVMNKEHKLLCEGTLSEYGDNYLQEGKWTEYYDNGAIKHTGYYYRGYPIGLWQRFYANGKPESLYSYSIINERGSHYYCLSGSYKEYYENGQLKTNGFYMADLDNKKADTMYVIDPITNERKPVVAYNSKLNAEKFGEWDSYTESGDLMKKENY